MILKGAAVELNTMLQIQVQGHPGRLKSYLVGKEEDHYLILKAPVVKNAAELFVKDKELIVRYVYQGRVFGFKAPIMIYLAETFNIIFVEFPKNIEDHNLRIHKRVECSLPARLEVLTDHQNRELRFRGIIGDLSKGGCKATFSLKEMEWTKEQLKINSEVALFLSLPGVESELVVQGTVRSILQDCNALSLGISFSDLTGKAQIQLNKFMEAYKL
ncbi:MAG: flagellar brake protein [Deltaproteobacteria bacterium]|nr:flagellar brake protein [Deltaproteobacteria bacterium]